MYNFFSVPTYEAPLLLSELFSYSTLNDSELSGVKRKFEADILTELAESEERQNQKHGELLLKLEELRMDKRVKLSVSRVTQRQFRELLEHGLSRQTVTFTVSPTTKSIQPFTWDPNKKKDAHAEEYLWWLNDNTNLPDDVEFYHASSKKDLTTSMARGKFTLKGTTDMAIIKKAYIEDANYAAGLLVGIEERKQIED
ncbi:hypothetical protein BC937DRAFT_89521 [Endogone sp. FLAS-F59071]|nr:hypothetical protein BC937DRAFT_89521 [Endogone sp. FLAS-F59071]|eukprot:RUS17759.1 hypothetical protein BC937DRAFT_89521 [Endogone sp. FLAS-F59071]